MSSDHAPRTDTAVANDQATSITAYLVAGPVTYGALGWLADRWLHTSFLVAVGILLGISLALYVVHVRYGRGASSLAEARSMPDNLEYSMNKEIS